MNNEIDEIMYNIEQAPHGRERMELCRQGWEIADKCGDYGAQFEFRYEYINEANYYDDGMQMYVVFPIVLKKHDEYVKEHGYDPKGFYVLWIYKWVLENAGMFYQITQEQYEKFAEDFKRRCMENGYSLRPYYEYGYLFYQKIDENKAKQFYEQFLKCRRDRMSDCAACERDLEVKYLLEGNQFELAVERAQDLLNFRLTCAEVPQITYGKFIQYYNLLALQGKMEIGEDVIELQERLRAAIRSQRLCMEYIGDMMLNYSLTNKAKALNWFKWYCEYADTMRNPGYKFYFAIGAMHFFAGMRDKEIYRMRLSSNYSLYREDGNYRPGHMYDYYKGIAEEIATKLDSRNKTDYYMRIVELVRF